MASFFDHQERARTRTGWLVALFLFGALGITACVTVLMAMVIPNSIPLAIGISLIIIGGPFLFKSLTIGSDGAKVALALGGVPIPPHTAVADERKVLNVVEEMAIASGMPIPTVYLLDEPSINAFAAGTGPHNAVIGVSRGAIEHLSRDELQGVMAHEFSHIFHGDMKINMRAISAIFALMALGYIGYFLLRGGSLSRSGRSSKGAGGILLVGVAFMVLGAIGTFFARLMQAAISRQREFLADASAVQYTRNPVGIGGALAKIARESGIQMVNPEASQFNHMLFSEGVRSLFASHPPLDERINRIRVMAGGVLSKATAAADPTLAAAPLDASRDASIQLNLVASIAGIGAINPDSISHARADLANAPKSKVDLAHDVNGAWALIMATLLSDDPAKRTDQLSLIASRDEAIRRLIDETLSDAPKTPSRQRLGLVEIASATLRTQSRSSYVASRALLAEVLKLDGRIDLFEWVVTEILRARVELALDVGRGVQARRSASLSSVARAVQRTLGILALLGTEDESVAETALAAGLTEAGLPMASLPASNERTLDSIADDLRLLEALRPGAAGTLLRAALVVVSHDSSMKQSEYLLLRALSERLAVPLPPALVQ
ncbi:MAG: hypothetical protein EXS03_08000 [Phycisphaerales bacterium]|nr:hypothetical protein [Phycisphaerales bacterium]